MQNFNHSPYPFTDYDQINISYGHQGLPFPTWNYPPPPPPPPPSAPSSGSSWSTSFSPNMTSLHHPSSIGDPHATVNTSNSSPYSSSSAAAANVIPKVELDDAFANSFGDFSSSSSPSSPHPHHPHSHSVHSHHYPHHHHHHHHHPSAGTGAPASVTPTLHHTSSLLQQTALLDHQPASTTLSSSSSPSTTSWKTSVASSTLGKTRTRDKYRVVYSEKQRVELEKEFYTSKYITIKRKAELAACLSLTERQVKIWFQNRRAKDRKQAKKKEEKNFCIN